MLNWDSLQSACLSCTRCPLSQTRHHVVFGVGPQDAEVLFVGEGPGENEDLQGEPFVGAAGKFLDEMLTIIDLGRHNCYITNIVKCRPPKNRDPMQTEQDPRAPASPGSPPNTAAPTTPPSNTPPPSSATRPNGPTPSPTSKPCRRKSGRSVRGRCKQPCRRGSPPHPSRLRRATFPHRGKLWRAQKRKLLAKRCRPANLVCTFYLWQIF